MFSGHDRFRSQKGEKKEDSKQDNSKKEISGEVTEKLVDSAKNLEGEIQLFEDNIIRTMHSSGKNGESITIVENYNRKEQQVDITTVIEQSGSPREETTIVIKKNDKSFKEVSESILKEAEQLRKKLEDEKRQAAENLKKQKNEGRKKQSLKRTITFDSYVGEQPYSETKTTVDNSSIPPEQQNWMETQRKQEQERTTRSKKGESKKPSSKPVVIKKPVDDVNNEKQTAESQHQESNISSIEPRTSNVEQLQESDHGSKEPTPLNSMDDLQKMLDEQQRLAEEKKQKEEARLEEIRIAEEQQRLHEEEQRRLAEEEKQKEDAKLEEKRIAEALKRRDEIQKARVEIEKSKERAEGESVPVPSSMQRKARQKLVQERRNKVVITAATQPVTQVKKEEVRQPEPSISASKEYPEWAAQLIPPNEIPLINPKKLTEESKEFWERDAAIRKWFEQNPHMPWDIANNISQKAQIMMAWIIHNDKKVDFFKFKPQEGSIDEQSWDKKFELVLAPYYRLMKQLGSTPLDPANQKNRTELSLLFTRYLDYRKDEAEHLSEDFRANKLHDLVTRVRENPQDLNQIIYTDKKSSALLETLKGQVELPILTRNESYDLFFNQALKPILTILKADLDRNIARLDVLMEVERVLVREKNEFKKTQRNPNLLDQVRELGLLMKVPDNRPEQTNANIFRDYILLRKKEAGLEVNQINPNESLNNTPEEAKRLAKNYHSIFGVYSALDKIEAAKKMWILLDRGTSEKEKKEVVFSPNDFAALDDKRLKGYMAELRKNNALPPEYVSQRKQYDAERTREFIHYRAIK